MNPINSKLIFLSVAILAYSCSSEKAFTPPSSETDGIPMVSTRAHTVAFDFKQEDLDTAHFVGSKDIQDYLYFKSKTDKSKGDVQSIESFDYEGATLFYVINYEKGFEIISADKRTQYLLGRGADGGFSMKDYEDTPWGTWMFTVAMDVLYVRLNPSAISEEGSENISFWNLISKSGHKGPPVIPPGYYEVTDTFFVAAYDTVVVEHLTETEWGFESPFNNYLPPNDSTLSGKCYVGCTPVAVAQLLYYYHDRTGYPTYVPTSAVYSGAPGNYSFTFSGSSSTIWNSMNVPSSYAGADVLMTWAAAGCETKYPSSSTWPLNIKPFFQEIGMDCEIYFMFGQLSALMEDQLVVNRMPLIVSASSIEPNPEISEIYSGHTFLVDGFDYSRNKTTYLYTWHYVTEPDPQIVIPDPPAPYTEEVYSFNSLVFVRMNWGWYGYQNSMEFTPGGAWGMYDNHGNYTNYHLFRYAQYDFTTD